MLEFFNIDLSLSELKRQLSYDHETGIFTRLITMCNKVKVGDIAGGVQNSGYVTLRVLGKLYLAHRLAWYYFYGEIPFGVIDHINGNKLDNRIYNLRVATRSENTRNSKTRVKKYTRFRGLSVRRNKRGVYWRVNIKLNKKNIYLGMFYDELEAYKVYLTKANELFGEYMHESLRSDYTKYIINKET